MKKQKTLITILVFILTLLAGTITAKASSSAKIYTSTTTAEVGQDVTITAEFTAAAWNVKINVNGSVVKSYASQTSDLSEETNIKEVKLDTSKAGTYTIIMSGDITDALGKTQEIENKKCIVTINEKKQETPTEQPNPEVPNIEPEAPKTLEFTSVNETVYSTGIVNVRESYNASSKKLGQLNKGDSITRTGISKTAGEDGNKWSKIIYNGKTAYVITSKLSTTKPVEEKPAEIPQETKAEEPNEEAPEEPETINQEVNTGEGLAKLEIEGFTISPEFSPEVYEYRVIVKENIDTLKIDAVANIEGSSISIAGNDNLQEGENLITIVVYNPENKGIVTYQITLYKNTLNMEETDQMLQKGTIEAKAKAIIFFSICGIIAIAFIIVIILKTINNEKKYKEDNIEKENNKGEKENSTEKEQNVEKQEKNEIQEEIQENIEKDSKDKERQEDYMPKREKKKGKHF